MLGKAGSQPQFLALFSVEQAVPADHPIRAIKKLVDVVLGELSPLLDAMYFIEGHPFNPRSASSSSNSATTCWSAGSWRWT